MTELNNNFPTSNLPENNGQAKHAQPTQPQAARPVNGPSPYNAVNYGNTTPMDSLNSQPVNATFDYQVPQKQAKQPKKKTGKTFLAGFAGAAVACALAFGGFGVYNAVTGSEAPAASKATTVVLGNQGATQVAVPTEGDETLAEAVAQKCLPSVVNIDVYTSGSGMTGYFGYGYGTDDSLVKSSLGSGVVLTEDGYIITNQHVVENGESFKVTIEGNEYEAELVGTDPSSDIAVIKARNASGLTPMELGDSDNLNIGEWVMTIGSPFGLEQSVATGIVSATSRSQVAGSSSYGSSTTRYYPNMIQTDAAINPGNSGGALVNADGQLIGLNTLITTNSGNYSGVGFAIPSNYAINLAQQIISGEEPTHAQLGVNLSTVNAATSERYGLATDSGAYVTGVSEGSGAANAGIQVGDIITSFNGNEVASASDLILDVRSVNPGDKVPVTVNRNGENIDLEVTMGEDTSIAAAEEGTQPQTDQNNPYGGNGYGYGYGNGGNGSNPYDGYGFNFGF